MIKPAPETTAITAMDVAAAASMLSGLNQSSAGTIKKPPPTPISPDKIPTHKPMTTNMMRFKGRLSDCSGSLAFFHMRHADHSTNRQKPSTNQNSLISWPSCWPVQLPGKPVTISSNEGVRCTSAERQRLTVPNSADSAKAPTLTPIAPRSGKCRQSNKGKATKEPPAPVKPSKV